MRTDWRPCEDGPDGDPCEREGCYVCDKFRTDLRYSYLWRAPKPVTPPIPPWWQLQFDRFLMERWYPNVRRLRRVWTFAKAAVRHTLAGLPRATAEDVAIRRRICHPCIFRDRERDECMQCGCSLGDERKLITKLAWAREQCPMEYWRSVPGVTVFFRLYKRLIWWL